MSPLELAKKYMHIVFTSGKFDELQDILAHDLKFNGPLYEFYTADSYLKSMQEAPPKEFEYEIIKSYEDESSACLLYNFKKPGISTLMTQTFETQNDKITSIMLVFDTSVFG